MAKNKVLIVEDDAELRGTLVQAFQKTRFQVTTACDGVEALEQVKANAPDLVLLDVNMPRMSGMECLKKIKEWDASIIVIVMTAYSAIEDAVQAVKDGAYNYLAKPIKHHAIVEMVEKALEAKGLVEDMAFSAPVVSIDQGEFVGNSTEMKKVFSVIYKLSKVDTAVLIRGESGTGKELVARAIHYNSSKKDQKLVAINCSSIAETLFESELFGHERGAFTGADQRHIGKFQFAEGGTIFLDEIGDLSSAMQVKLLRVLQEKKFTPVGSNREIEMDVRIIAATNRNLEEMMTKGTFREDLFYRLNVIPIYLPPLRERKDDIERLVSHFIQKFNVSHRKAIKGVTGEALSILLQHHWPGNIRELENVIEHAFVIEGNEKISSASLPNYLKGSGISSPLEQDDDDDVFVETGDSAAASGLDYRSFKEKFEKEFIVKALSQFKGKINQTAIHAGIPKKTLLRKLQKYGIRAEDFRE